MSLKIGYLGIHKNISIYQSPQIVQLKLCPQKLLYSVHIIFINLSGDVICCTYSPNIWGIYILWWHNFSFKINVYIFFRPIICMSLKLPIINSINCLKINLWILPTRGNNDYLGKGVFSYITSDWTYQLNECTSFISAITKIWFCRKACDFIL